MKRYVALSDQKIAALRPGAARYAIYDRQVPGLAVRVQPTGHKSYVLGARYPNDPHFTRRELGQVGRIDLAEARAKARAWLALIEKGTDPREAEAREREAAQLAAGNAFAAVAEDFIVRHLRGKRKARVVERDIRKELIPVWGEKPIGSITRRDVVILIERIADRGRGSGAYARNIFDHIRAVFSWAINRSIYNLEHSPVDRLKPRDLLGAKRQRERVLTDDELIALWRATARTPYPFGVLVRLIMLTGVRLNEAAAARWREFDDTLWVIPAARFKMNAEHRVPLTSAAKELLMELPRWTRSDYVFSVSGEAPFKGLSRAKTRLDQRMLRSWRALGRARGVDRRQATFDNWTLHDVRRTVRTRLSELRVPEAAAELVIGHSKKGLARIYNQHEFADEMREALELWSSRLRSIVEPQVTAKVVMMTGRRA
jgi:integrase